MKTLIISNEEMKPLEESNLLIKSVCEAIRNERNNKKLNFSACY